MSAPSSNFLKFNSQKHGVRSGPGQLYRTRLCKYGADCSYGDRCYYAHSEKELRQRMALPVTEASNGRRDKTGRQILTIPTLKKVLTDTNHVKPGSEVVLTRALPAGSVSTISSNHEASHSDLHQAGSDLTPPPPPCPPTLVVPDPSVCSWSSTCEDCCGKSASSVSPIHSMSAVDYPSAPYGWCGYYECVLRLMQQHTSLELYRILKNAEPAYYTE